MASPLILVIDVGNTATSFAIFPLIPYRPRPVPHSVWTVSTSDLRHPGSLKKILRRHLKKQVRGVMVSSVVPGVDRSLNTAVRSVLGIKPKFVSSATPSKVRVRYKKPREVGADRLVNARAAIALRRGASIVVDFGTATTFDCVSKRGEYLGGVIAPGPVISAEALYQRTAKLPHVILTRPVDILGRNTLESIQSGLYHGYRGLVREIVAGLKKRLGPSTAVLTTGGQAHWILKGLAGIDEHVPHLTLMGLYHAWFDVHGKTI